MSGVTAAKAATGGDAQTIYKLTGEALIEDMTPAELERARQVESVLPALRELAAKVDEEGEFLHFSSSFGGLRHRR